MTVGEIKNYLNNYGNHLEVVGSIANEMTDTETIHNVVDIVEHEVDGEMQIELVLATKANEERS